MASLKSLGAFVGGHGIELDRAFVAGAAANTPIAVAGLSLRAVVISVVKWAAGVPTDVTAQASIPSAGHIELTGDTTGDTVEVLYAQPLS